MLASFEDYIVSKKNIKQQLVCGQYLKYARFLQTGQHRLRDENKNDCINKKTQMRPTTKCWSVSSLLCRSGLLQASSETIIPYHRLLGAVKFE